VCSILFQYVEYVGRCISKMSLLKQKLKTNNGILGKVEFKKFSVECIDY